MISDRDMPTGTIFGVNSDVTNLEVLLGTDTGIGPFEETALSDAANAKMLLSAVMKCTEPRANFVINGGPADRTISG